jgi:CubicO group peptidase (beta-lactamase class C family)
MYFNFIKRLMILFVLCSCGAPPASAQKPTDSSQPSAQQIVARIDEYMNAAVKNYHYSGSVLVARAGAPLFRKSYGMANYELNVPNTSQTRFRLASITKQFTATAIMILQERGKLNVSDPICKYLENCPPAWQPITVRNLLTHTSGILNHHAGLPRYAELTSDRQFTYNGFVELFRAAPLQFTPGERYDYSNSGYFLLGLIIERVSGKTYAEFMRENIFAPLGMKNSGYDDSRTLVPNRADGYNWNGKSFINAPHHNMGVSFAAGSLYSTTEDLLLWDQALYTEKIVSRKSLDEMFTPFRNEYGYGWNVDKRFNRQRLRHSGGISGFSNDFARFPAERVAVIVLGNNRDAYSDNINSSLSAIVFAEPYEMPRQAISEALAAIITQKGVDFAVRQYRELKRTRPNGFDFREPQLNWLGYDLLGAGKVKEALEIFKLNVEAYPQSANAYDSLAEAYMRNGDKESAVKNYEKSLELNPQNKNGADMLKKLKGAN